MTQVIMIFLLPIGIYFYFFVERKDRDEYQRTFDDFQNTLSQNTRLTQTEKMNRFTMMLRNNGYRIISEDKESVTGEKKIFSMSLFVIGLGFFYVGVVIYLLYFFYFQSPHSVRYTV